MRRNTETVYLTFLFIAALILRAGYTLFLQHHYLFYDHPSSDVLYYLNWANALVTEDGGSGGIFFGLPLYPYVLAFLLKLGGGHLWVPRAFFLVLGSLNCLLIYRLGKRIFSVPVAVLASLLSALNFHFIYYDWLLMPVTLLITLGLIILLAVTELREDSRLTEFGFLGTVLGIASLGDGKFVIFASLLFTYWFFRFRRSDRLGKILLVFLTGFALILFASALRNRMTGREWVLIGAQKGYNFYAGNNPHADGTYKNPGFLRPSHGGLDADQKAVAQQVTGRPLSPRQVSDFWMRQGLRFIRQNPMRYVQLLLKKFALFWTAHEKTFDIDLILQARWRRLLDINPYRLVVAMAVIGFLVCVKLHRQTVFLNLLVLSQLIFSLIFFVSHRHRITVWPVFLLYESAALVHLWRWARGRNWIRLFSASIGLCVLLFLLNPVELTCDERQFLYDSKAAPVWEARGRFKKAEALYRKALRVHPRDVNNLYNLGTLLAKSGKLNEAERLFNRALAINPYDPNLYYNLGYVNKARGHIREAVKNYNKTLALEPQSPDALYQLAELYRQQGRCHLAVPLYRKISEISPRLHQHMIKIIRRCRLMSPHPR